MRLLLDQDVYKATAEFLRALNHDVVLASELGMAQAADEQLLQTAQHEKCIFVTRDRDFGTLVFIRRILTGVLYLRMTPLTQTAVHQELERVLSRYSEDRLKHSYLVIEADGHRIRNLTT